MKTPSETVQAAQRLLAERERVGLAKYGTTVDRTDLQAGDWLKHAIEEASDLLLYLIRLQQAAEGLMPRFTSPFASDGNCDPDADLLGNQFSDIRAAHDRAAYLARWANAPEWAQWLAQDGDAWCFWFSGKPYPHEILGWCLGHPGENKTAGYNLLGRVACEPRPTPAVDLERAAYLKRWEGAPEWAQWLSQDPDGRCDFFESMPVQDDRGVWGLPNDIDFYSGAERFAGYNLLGPYRCEQRPTLEGRQGVGE